MLVRGEDWIMGEEKRRILIADDEVNFTTLVKRNLERSGQYEVRVENDATKVLAVARAFQPDLILLDVIMPGADGGSVAEALGAEPRLAGIPIVFLTAVLTKEEAAAQHGAIARHPFIAKPVTAEELLAHVEKYIKT